jgi:hypothetical protein
MPCASACEIKARDRSKRKACIEKGEIARDDDDDDGKSKRKGRIINTKGGKHLYKDKSTVFLISHSHAMPLIPFPTVKIHKQQKKNPLSFIHSFILALPCLALVSLHLFHHSLVFEQLTENPNTKSKQHPENQSIQL